MKKKIIKILEILKNRELMAAACHKGITEMFRTSWFPILPRVLIKEGLAPNKWFRAARQSSSGLSLNLVKHCLGINPIEGLQRLKAMGLPYEETEAISEYFSQILNWEEIIKDISSYSETVRDLGVLWYLSIVFGSEDLPEILKELKIDVKKVNECVTKLVEFLNEKTSICVAKEKQPVVKWDDIFRLPI